VQFVVKPPPNVVHVARTNGTAAGNNNNNNNLDNHNKDQSNLAKGGIAETSICKVEA